MLGNFKNLKSLTLNELLSVSVVNKKRENPNYRWQLIEFLEPWSRMNSGGLTYTKQIHERLDINHNVDLLIHI